MGFDAQAFATAFLTDQAKEIKARFAKAEEYEEEQKKKAERNLTIFQKRRKEKNVLKQYAATLSKIGATNEQIMYFAKDGPLALKAIHDAMSLKAGKAGGLSKEDISEMMDIPQGFEKAAGKYKSIDEFLEASYRLSEEHDKFEPPETPESVKGNWLLGVMGIGAKDNVDRKLETEKYLGDLTIGQINRVAAQDDFINVFGDTFGTAALDPTAGPKIVDFDTKEKIILATQKLNARKQNSKTKVRDRVIKLVRKKLDRDDSTLSMALIKALYNEEKGSDITRLSKDIEDKAKLEEAKDLFYQFKDEVEYEALTEAITGFNYGASEIKQISPTLGKLYTKFNPTAVTTEEGTEDKSDETQKTDVGEYDYGSMKELNAAIKSLKAGVGEYKVRVKGSIINVPVDKKKVDELIGVQDEDKTKKEEETTIEPDMSEEQFNALEEKVDPKPGILYVADRNKWIKQYGKTHNDDGTRKTYKEYTTGQSDKKGIMTKGQRRKESR